MTQLGNGVYSRQDDGRNQVLHESYSPWVYVFPWVLLVGLSIYGMSES